MLTGLILSAVVAIPARAANVYVHHLVVNVIWAILVHAAAKHAQISILQRLPSAFRSREWALDSPALL